MKITGNLYVNTYSFQAKKKSEPKKSERAQLEKQEVVPYQVDSLREMYNVKPKNIDINASKAKLLRQLNEVLDANRDISELFSNYLRQQAIRDRDFIRRAEQIFKERDEFVENLPTDAKSLKLKFQDIEARRAQLEKEIRKKYEFVLPEKRDDKLDCALLNAFKRAALEDNFNFEKVYQDYYKDLNTVTSVEDMKKRYPKIKVPTPAHIVIAERVEDCITRDFYEELQNMFLMHADNNYEIEMFCENKVKQIIAKNPKLSELEYKRIVDVAVIHLACTFKKLYDNDSISSVPEIRKNKTVQLSNLDIKLLGVDYQDFTLSVMRQMYLEHKNPSAIKYSDGKNTISLSELQGTPYKIEKSSDKIKPFIRAGLEIEAAKRNYSVFDDQQLQDRLEFFMNKDIANNEKFLEKFIDFSSCDLSTKDKDNFIKFLRMLDSVVDKNISEDNALEIIENNDIKPHETAKKQEAERLQMLENLRLEQQKTYELNTLKSEFDDAINVLYMNDMSGLASTCSDYRPETLDKKSIENANFIINTIISNCSKDYVIEGKDRVKSIIISRDAYNYYSENEPDSEIFKNAKKYAQDYDGNVDIEKAGNYLRNAEIVKNAPKSLEYVNDKEIIEGIINREKSEDKKIRYLCKFDEYNNLSDEQKTKINEFIDLFYLDDNVEKYILKQIIETKYVKTDTVAQARINDNGDTVDTTITANAKKQILAKYRFPTCLTYLQGFEDGMKMLATDKGSTGIKKTGTNNKALEYKLEIKVMGHDDRLFSKENDYIFDVFSDRGLH